MERKLVVSLIVVCGILASLAVIFSFFRFNRSFNKDGLRPKLVVYTYSSFRDVLGPGPEIVKKFEKICLCDIEMIDAGSGNVLLEKLVLGKDHQVDVVIGFDQLTLKNAIKKIKWRKVDTRGVAWDQRLQSSVYPMFVPYDWSPLTFIYREGDLTPEDDLYKWVERLPKKSIALQDPALSSIGLQLVYWVYGMSGDSSYEFIQFFKALKPKIHSINAKWSDAYSVFQSGHARGAFTYLTSLAYHWLQENDHRYRVIEFTQGHPQQIEYMGIPQQCMSCGIAEDFVQFLLKPENQKIIMEKNYMLPAVAGVVDGTVFAGLPSLKLIDTKKMDEFVDHQPEIINRWSQAIQ